MFFVFFVTIYKTLHRKLKTSNKFFWYMKILIWLGYVTKVVFRLTLSSDDSETSKIGLENLTNIHYHVGSNKLIKLCRKNITVCTTFSKIYDVLSFVLWCPLRFPHKTIFGLSLPPVVCRRVMFYLRYLYLFAYSGVQHILCCIFALFVFVSECQFVIAPLVFSNVYVLAKIILPQE